MNEPPLTMKVGSSVLVPPGDSAHALGMVNVDYNVIEVTIETHALKCVNLSDLKRRDDTVIVGLHNYGSETVRAVVSFQLWRKQRELVP